MRRSIPMAFVCAIAALQTLYAQPSAAPLPVRRVVLYKNGVGYFEHVGRVRGTQSLAIDFNSAQLNDVLKSLTTIDLGDGRIGNVSFNTDAPLAQRLGALTLPAGERRLLSYAVDLGVQVEPRNGDSLDQLTHIRIDRGTLVHQSEQRTRKVYTVRNNDTSSRTVVIEHPIRAGWALSHDLKPVETSLNAYRFAVAVSAQSTATLTIDERHPMEQQLSVSTLTEQHLAFFVRATRADASLARALAPVSAKKAAIASLEQELKAREAESTRIAEDQARLRDNMRSLKGSDGEKQLLKRYVAHLNEQEDRIAALRREAADISQRLVRAQAELSQLIETLSVDVDLRETD